MKKALLLAVPLILAGCSEEFSSEKEVQQALSYIDKQKHEEGIIHLKNALQQSPELAQARQLLADAYLVLGQASEAELQYRKLLDMGIDKNQIIVPLSKSLLKQNKFSQLLDEAEFSGDLSQISNKDHASLYALRSLAYIAENQPSQAKEQLQKAFMHDENNVDAKLAKAGILFNDGKYKEGLELTHKILSFTPENVTAWLLLGDVEKQHLNLSHAEKAYTSALQYAHKKSTEYYYAILNRALVRAYQDQFSNAREDVNLARQTRANEVYTEYVSGLIDFRAQNYQDAANSFNKVISTVPDHMLSHLYLGTTHFIQKRPQLAREHLLYFSKNYAGHPLAEKVLVATELQLGLNEEATQRLQNLVQSEGADPDTLNLIGANALANGDIESGIESLKSVLEQKPVWPGALVRVGLGEMEKGNFATANQAFDKAIDQNQNAQSTYIYKFINYLKSNKVDQAIAFLGGLNNEQIDTKLRHNLLGIAYMNMRNVEKARQAFNVALESDIGDPTAQHNLATIAWNQGKAGEALMHYQNVLSVYPNNLRTYLKLAAANLHLFKIGDAEANLTKAVKIDANYLPARLALAKLYLDTNRYTEGLSVLNEASDEQQQHPMIITLKGIGHAHLEQWSMARTSLDQIKNRHTDYLMNEQVQFLNAYVIGHEQGAKAALTLLEALYKDYPNSRNVINLASAYFRTQRAQQGEKILVQWLDGHKYDAMVRLTLANYYLTHKQESNALKEFEQVAEVVPNHPLVLNNIAWLLKDTQTKRALTIIKKALEIAPNDERIGDTYQVIKRKLNA